VRPTFGVDQPEGRRISFVPVARNSDPETSWEAALSLSAQRIRESQTEILRILRENGPLCDQDIAKWTHQSPSGARTRRSELVLLGFVEDTGERVRLPSGRRSIVWAAK
jgi:hypothetical protein